LSFCSYLLRIIFAASLLNLVGCYFSFHSNQYQLAKSLLPLKEKIGGGQPDWALDWNGYSFPILAVTVDNDVWFVGPDDLVLVFDGWQIIETSNLLPLGGNAKINLRDNKMTINDDSGEVREFDCVPWLKNVISDGSVIHKQNCQTENREFQNVIRVNPDGQITELNFLIHQEYPKVKLTNLVF